MERGLVAPRPAPRREAWHGLEWGSTGREPSCPHCTRARAPHALIDSSPNTPARYSLLLAPCSRKEEGGEKAERLHVMHLKLFHNWSQNLVILSSGVPKTLFSRCTPHKQGYFYNITPWLPYLRGEIRTWSSDPGLLEEPNAIQAVVALGCQLITNAAWLCVGWIWPAWPKVAGLNSQHDTSLPVSVPLDMTQVFWRCTFFHLPSWAFVSRSQQEVETLKGELSLQI